jgi:hypothetical protein
LGVIGGGADEKIIGLTAHLKAAQLVVRHLGSIPG